MKRRLIVILLICVLVFCCSVQSVAKEESLVYDSRTGVVRVTNKDYRMLDEIIQSIYSVSTREGVRSLSADCVSDSVRAAVEKRVQMIDDMEEVMVCSFDDVRVSPMIAAAEYTDRETIAADVYLTTEVLYHYPEIENSTDYMAYGEVFSIKVKKTGLFGKAYKIISDESNSLANDTRNDSSSEEDLSDDEDDPSQLIRTYNSYSVNSAMGYAVTYCGFPVSRRYQNVSGLSAYSGNPIHGPAYYNTQTYNYYTHDCANYVSQCLAAGGIPTSQSWQNGTTCFIGAAEMINYLKSMQYGSRAHVSSTCGNVYPGNPVFWTEDNWSTDNDTVYAFHVGICTGYNTANVPVVCAHTTDAYRVPMSALTVLVTSSHQSAVNNTNPVYSGTILISNYNKHTYHTNISGTYYYNSDYHFHVCTYCERPTDSTQHVLGVHGECEVCGMPM